ncbi:MAG: 3'-5' exonuclease [candidate division KSB1 bacterium]|jgi:DNA polymerase-3 subunit epsilon|nr:3'-5' exonuclease [candidate division KSB1 bacterium]
MNAAMNAKKLMGLNPVFLDTETTGLNAFDQIVEIAVIDIQGGTLIDTLVKPTITIPPDASKIHGITNEMVGNAPLFPVVLRDLQDSVGDRPLLIYNADYDLKMLRQSAAAHRLNTQMTFNAYCVMKMYAEFYGDWNEYYQNYRWQSLGSAAKQCRIDLPEDLHRARVDAELTRLVFIHMANQSI